MRWPQKLLAGMLVALLFFGGAEGLLRLLLGPPPPPVRVYRALGEHDRYFQASGGGDTVSALYDAEATVEDFPAAGSGPRVVVMGGSSVHGGSPGVTEEWEFSGRLQALTGAETLNLGQPGLDSFDLVRMLDELLAAAVQMDVLVIYAGHNDFGNTLFENRYGTLRAGLSARALSVLGRLQLFSQLSRVLQPISGSARRAQDHQQRTNEGARPLNAARKEVALQGLRANLERIAWQTARADVALVLVTPVSRLARRPGRRPCPPDLPAEVCPQALFDKAQAARKADPALAAALLRQARDVNMESVCAPTAAQEVVLEVAGAWSHVAGIDAEHRLPRDPEFDVPASNLFVDHLHLSRQGHIAVAELIVPAVQEALGRP